MNNRKSIDDLSKNYLKNKGKRFYNWSKLWAQKVTEINNSKLTPSEKLTYFLLHPALNEHGGYLKEDLKYLAARFHLDEFKLASHIDKLVKVDALRKRDDGMVYDARMVEDIGEETDETNGSYTKLTKIQTKQFQLALFALEKLKTWSQ